MVEVCSHGREWPGIRVGLISFVSDLLVSSVLLIVLQIVVDDTELRHVACRDVSVPMELCEFKRHCR